MSSRAYLASLAGALAVAGALVPFNELSEAEQNAFRAREAAYRPPRRPPRRTIYDHPPFSKCKRCKGIRFVIKTLDHPWAEPGEHFVRCFKCDGHGKVDSSNPPHGVGHPERLGRKHPGEKTAWEEDGNL